MIKKGTTARIKPYTNLYGNRLSEKVGVVTYIAPEGDKVGVFIKDSINPSSRYGYFYFPECYLEPVGTNSLNSFSIKKVHFNNPVTVVLWNDGTKTVVKSGKHDIYDPEKGLAMAIAKKALGNKGRYYDIFKKWLPEQKEVNSAEKIRTHSCDHPDCSTCCYENFTPTSLPCCYCTLANNYKYYKRVIHRQNDSKYQDYINCDDCKYHDVNHLCEPCCSCMDSEEYCPEFIPRDF